jgi:putative membrane protein
VFQRLGRATEGWRYYLPVQATLALSAVYEMMEAGVASIVSPQRGEEFVGMQGDIFDSQKDMFNATMGAIVAMLIVYAVRKHRAAATVKVRAQSASFAD